MMLAVLVAAQLLTKSTGLGSQFGPQLRVFDAAGAAGLVSQQQELESQQGLQPQHNKSNMRGKVQRFRPKDNEFFSLGVMNKVGVTTYSTRRMEAARSNSGKSFWPEGTRTTSEWTGATDLSENVSWGWHHPNGVYNTIPVGAPLIDADTNIYLGTDDAIRKFSSAGELLWSYGPRGQLAAAPSLLDLSVSRFADLGAGSTDKGDSEDAAMVGELAPPSSSRKASSPNVIEDDQDNMDEMDVEHDLAPEWVKPAAGGDQGEGAAPVQLRAGASRLASMLASRLSSSYERLAARMASKAARVKAGDFVKVRPGVGNEHYQAGDMGAVTKTIYEGGVMKANIKWLKTGQESVEALDSFSRLFMHIGSKVDTGRRATTMLVGSTTSGSVFALDTTSGEELWVTQASEQIAGVKGVVSGYGAVVISATDRCTDRYCYKYRNLVNPLMPGNSQVRAMLAIDGSPLWAFKPTSPVWNFVPQYGSGSNGDTVMFSDFEGTVYCLSLATGELVWKQEGAMGTYTQAAALYHAELNQIFAFGLEYYEGKDCNPFVPIGITWPCNTHVGSPGWMRTYNASSGRLLWEKDLPEPPSSATVGKLNTPRLHTRVVVTMGHNCNYGARSLIWALDPGNGHFRWEVEGPTLWSDMCAGDKEGGDIRRAMGGRAACVPGAWSAPVIDSNGDLYVGSQVGVLQRLGAEVPNAGGARDHSLLSSLSTQVAFQDNAIAFAPGMMAVTTCTSLIVFQTYTSHDQFGKNDTWEFPTSMY